MEDIRPIVGRLAPSPTGGLHVGHARTFLIAWWMARSAGGRVILRIEDLDAGRNRPGMAEQAMADLRWLGIDWDEGPELDGPRGPYVQSERAGLYRDALAHLKDLGLVYPCTCSRADIARAASAPHAEDEGPVYPGTCAARTPEDAAGLDRPHAWRFRVGPAGVAWDDLFRGRMEYAGDRLGGDFVLARSDGVVSYQLAVVVDDAAMGVTQVVRGDDLIPSTPRQLLLDAALGLRPPMFGHVGLVIDATGRRLAKRDGSVKLATLRETGTRSSEVVEWAARSCGLIGERRGAADWIVRFEPSGCGQCAVWPGPLVVG